MCAHYTVMCAFVEERSQAHYGRVNHALCAAIRAMLTVRCFTFTSGPSADLALQEYRTLVCQLEHACNTSDFSLQKFWYHLHPSLRVLALLHQLVEALEIEHDGSSLSSQSSGDSPAEFMKGGEVLAVLHERMQSMAGDPVASVLYGTLFRAAGVPYVAMITRWMTLGRLDDPFKEFCVKENKFITRAQLDADYTDDYWDHRFTVRPIATKNVTDLH